MTATSIYLNVKDASASIAFYEKLGFRAGDAAKAENGRIQWVELTRGECTFAMGEISSNQDTAFQAWVNGTLGRGVLISHRVPDLDAVFEKAQAAKTEIESGIEKMGDDRFFMISDPDGYSLMFTGA